MNRLMEYSVFWVCDGLPFGWFAYQRFAFAGERDDTGSGAAAFLIGDDACFATFHHGHD